jgi:Domain of unknown function (DUF6457)
MPRSDTLSDLAVLPTPVDINGDSRAWRCLRIERSTERVYAAARMTAQEWCNQFAARLGVDAPDEATVEQLLALAGVAAHASERIAAPIACYLVGRAGADPDWARSVAATIEAGGDG